MKMPRTAEDLLSMLAIKRRLDRNAIESVWAGDIAKAVAAIYAEALGVDEVESSDSVFDLGGDSLHIVGIIMRVRELFEVELTFGDVFDAPTAKELAHVIEKRRQPCSETT